MIARTARLIVLTVLLVVAFALLSIVNYQNVAAAVHDEIVSSSLPLLQENLYTEIQADLTPALNISSMMSADSFLIRWAEAGERTPEQIIEYLQTIRDQYGYFSVFFVSEKSRNYYHQTGITKQISPQDDHDRWYFDFTGAGDIYTIQVDSNQAANDRLTIFVNYRLEDFSGNLLGVTGVGMEMDGFAAFLRSRQEKYNRTIYLVDRDGVVQAHPDLSLIQRLTIGEHPMLGPVAQQLLTVSDLPIDAEYEKGRETILVSSRYMPELDWFLVVEQNETEALRSARGNLVRTVLVGLVVSAAVIVVIAMTLRHFDRRLETLATTDSLTGASNRRAFDERLAEAQGRSERSGSQLSLVLFDVDRLKEINDEHGHLAGDKTLRHISDVVREVTRPTATFARWGGDEFALLVESDSEGARQVVERVRDRITHPEQESTATTVSVGIATYESGESLQSLLRRADQALYRSKQEGRDRVTVAT